MSNHLTGIFPVLPTPFDDQNAVDPEAMRRLVRFAMEAKVGGVVFPGFASEVESLSHEERTQMLGVVAAEIGDVMPIIAGASAQSPDEVIEHGRKAMELGISYLMVQPPQHLGSQAEPIIDFLQTITQALPESQIIFQNAPAPRGSDLSPETLLAIAAAITQVVYIKEETLPAGPAITSLLAHKPATLRGVIGGGGARYILDEYERGACAAMPAIEIAQEHVALDRAWRDGDAATARELYIKTLPLLTLQAVYRMRLTKHVMVRRGILNNTSVRASVAPLDPLAIADIDANLVELGAVDAMPAFVGHAK